MTSRPTVWVVVPVHNRRHFTEPFLACMARQTYQSLKVIIFDDGSTDGTSEMIRQKFPSVILLHGDGNVWWTASVNRGIRRALEQAGPSDYLLIMNDDVEVGPQFVSVLTAFAAEHPDALVGGVTTNITAPQCIDDGGVRISALTAKYRILNHGRALADFPRGHFEQPDLLTGRTTLLPVHVARDIGLYDERNFVNCADTELPVRASRRGYALYVVYDAVIASHVGAVAKENYRGTYSLRMLPTYLFGIKSYTRLKYRWHFAWTFTRHNPVWFLVFFVTDLTRITVHFVRGLLRQSFNPTTTHALKT